MSRNAHAKSGVDPTMDLVPTPVGTAGVTWYPALGSVRAVALLGHGSATGVEAPDLAARHCLDQGVQHLRVAVEREAHHETHAWRGALLRAAVVQQRRGGDGAPRRHLHIGE